MKKGAADSTAALALRESALDPVDCPQRAEQIVDALMPSLRTPT